MKQALFVFMGGGLGAIARYGLNLAFVPLYGQWTTFAINIIGSFLIGTTLGTISHISLKAFFVTGILGGFTTFSTFQLELLLLIQQRQYTQAFCYGVCSLITGLVAVGLGFFVVKYFYK